VEAGLNRLIDEELAAYVEESRNFNATMERSAIGLSPTSALPRGCGRPEPASVTIRSSSIRPSLTASWKRASGRSQYGSSLVPYRYGRCRHEQHRVVAV
jgi:hypothetical protein